MSIKALLFLTNHNFNNYNLIILGERPFECDVCGIRFSHKFALRAHMQSHDPKHVEKLKKSLSDVSKMIKNTKLNSEKNGQKYQIYALVDQNNNNDGHEETEAAELRRSNETTESLETESQNVNDTEIIENNSNNNQEEKITIIEEEAPPASLPPPATLELENLVESSTLQIDERHRTININDSEKQNKETDDDVIEIDKADSNIIYKNEKICKILKHNETEMKQVARSFVKDILANPPPTVQQQPSPCLDPKHYLPLVAKNNPEKYGSDLKNSIHSILSDLKQKKKNVYEPSGHKKLVPIAAKGDEKAANQNQQSKRCKQIPQLTPVISHQTAIPLAQPIMLMPNQTNKIIPTLTPVQGIQSLNPTTAIPLGPTILPQVGGGNSLIYTGGSFGNSQGSFIITNQNSVLQPFNAGATNGFQSFGTLIPLNSFNSNTLIPLAAPVQQQNPFLINSISRGITPVIPQIQSNMKLNASQKTQVCLN